MASRTTRRSTDAGGGLEEGDVDSAERATERTARYPIELVVGWTS